MRITSCGARRERARRQPGGCSAPALGPAARPGQPGGCSAIRGRGSRQRASSAPAAARGRTTGQDNRGGQPADRRSGGAGSGVWGLDSASPRQLAPGGQHSRPRSGGRPAATRAASRSTRPRSGAGAATQRATLCNAGGALWPNTKQPKNNDARNQAQGVKGGATIGAECEARDRRERP